MADTNIKRIGDWRNALALVANLNNDMERARKITLKRVGLYAEGKAKKHMSKQDLKWLPLKPRTITAKVRRGESEKTLIATSSYFQSITSWVKKDKVLIGVKRNVVNRKGQVIANIARVHEFGSSTRNIPARPLWKPVLKETVKFMGKSKDLNPSYVFLNIIKQKYGV